MTVRALALGINQYRDPLIPALQCCERDAREVTSVLKDGFGFDAHYLEERMTEQIEQRIEDLGTQLKPGDTFVFYFSGHGKAHSGDHYLLLPGARLGAFESGAVVASGVLSYRNLKHLTAGPAWKGVHRLFIIDACRCPLLKDKAGELAVCDAEYLLRLPRPAADAFAEPDERNVTLLNSCAVGASAVELPGEGHGVFTASLLDLLRKPRGNARDLMIDSDFVGALGETMTSLAKKSRLPESVLHQPVLVGEGVRLAADSVVEEIDDDEIEWELAKAEGNINALKAYVRRKPPGKHRPEALVLITELFPPPKPPPPPPKGGAPWLKGALVLFALGLIVAYLNRGKEEKLPNTVSLRTSQPQGRKPEVVFTMGPLASFSDGTVTILHGNLKTIMLKVCVEGTIYHSGRCDGSDREFSLEEAQQAVLTANQASYAGYSNWRMPTELESDLVGIYEEYAKVMDSGKVSDMAEITKIFPNGRSGLFTWMIPFDENWGQEGKVRVRQTLISKDARYPLRLVRYLQ